MEDLRYNLFSPKLLLAKTFLCINEQVEQHNYFVTQRYNEEMVHG